MVFFDDIFMCSNCKEYHVKHLSIVLQRLRDENFYVKSRCVIFGLVLCRSWGMLCPRMVLWSIQPRLRHSKIGLGLLHLPRFGVLLVWLATTENSCKLFYYYDFFD